LWRSSVFGALVSALKCDSRLKIAKRVSLRALETQAGRSKPDVSCSSKEELRMARIERTEVFGRHIICATASMAPGAHPRKRWRVSVSAVELGGAVDRPMLEFPTLEQDDAATALELAIQRARKELAAAGRI